MPRLVLCAVALTAMVACGSGGNDPCQGALACECFPNSTCNATLACVSGVCVKPPGPHAGSSSGTSPAAAAGTHGTAPSGSAGGSSGNPGNPSNASGASGPSSTPIDAGISTLDGSAGSAAAGIGAAGGGGLDASAVSGGNCVPAGGNCSAACCGGALCVQGVCAADCVRDDQCLSGCCFALSSGKSVCAPAIVCPAPDASSPSDDAAVCAGAGAACSSASCCGGALCVENVCANACSANSACASGCCFQSTCAPANLCALPDAGVPAGGGGIQCSATPPVSPSSTIQTHIDGDFDGWQGGTVFWLQNGELWQQVSYAYLYHYAFSPSVTIAPESGTHRMTVDGVSTSITAAQLAVVEESQIVSEFQGLMNGAMFTLANGQVWRQSDPTVLSQFESMPEAAIFCSGGSFELAVKGLDTPVQVTQLK